jgi:GxxExxY protein
MPISVALDLTRIAKDDFHEVDYIVTGLAFELHRDLGPWFIDESIYRDELARMCEARGLTACTELRATASFASFAKTYFLVLVVNKSIPYELKAVQTIHPAHRTQTLNYLMLTGLAHAKILNMRAPSVEYEFVSTSVTSKDRYLFEMELECWRDLDGDSVWFRDTMRSLIAEWGLFLDLTLFYDAVSYFRGGDAAVIKPINIVRGNRAIGQQLVRLINEHTAFKITAISKDLNAFENRLRRFLWNSSLSAIQWVNFDRHNVAFKTLVRDPSI